MLDKTDILKRERERERADMNQICWGGCIYIAAVIAVVSYWSVATPLGGQGVPGNTLP